MQARLMPLVAACGLLLSVEAWANQRHFTHLYESAVLPKGVVELEPWVTARLGKDGYYTGLDNRLEFEFGLGHNQQVSLYLNWSGEGERVGKDIVSRAEHKGVSGEWKMKLSDPVADALGSALYAEVTVAPEELEVEGKLLLDKHVGPWLLAANAVYEWEDNFREGIFEHKLAALAGVSYRVTEHFTLGVEALAHHVLETAPGASELELEHAAVFAGPVASWGFEHGWLAASVTPQLRAYGEASEGRGLDLDAYQRVWGRVLMGFHL